MKRLILALALLLSCARPVPHVAIAEGFTNEERASIARAAEKWNTIVREPVRVDGGPWKLVKQTPPDAPTKLYIGQTDYPGKTIFIAPDLDSRTFFLTVLHEFGHAQGLHHIPGPGIMNATIGAPDFTEGDLEECRRVNVCGLSPIDQAKCRLSGACP